MVECKKCGKEFIPQKGLISYCSLSCRNSRDKEKIRLSVKEYYKKNPEAKQNISKFRKGKSFLTEEGRQRLRKLAIERELGGLNSKKKFFYKGVYLQSSYEYRLAIILDELSIKWERPKPLTYFLEKERKYYADFYLLDFSIYIDTKNSYLAVKDKPKIDTVSKQNDVIVLILLEEHLNKKYISERFQ